MSAPPTTRAATSPSRNAPERDHCRSNAHRLTRISVATMTTTPSGWTQLGTTQSYTTGETAVFYKTLAGTEGGTAYTATSGAANYWAAAIVVYRNTTGIDQNGGSNVFAGIQDLGGTTNTFPGLTTIANEDTIVYLSGERGTAAGAYTHTGPGTEREDTSSSRGGSILNAGVAVYDVDGPDTAGAVSSTTGTTSVTTNAYIFTVAIKPPAATITNMTYITKKTGCFKSSNGR